MLVHTVKSFWCSQQQGKNDRGRRVSLDSLISWHLVVIRSFFSKWKCNSGSSFCFLNLSPLYTHSRFTQSEIHHWPQPDGCICSPHRWSSSLCRGCSAPQSFKSHLGFSGPWNSFLRAPWSIDPAIQSTGQSCLNELFTDHHRKQSEMADGPQLGPDGDGAAQMGRHWCIKERQRLWTVRLSMWL